MILEPAINDAKIFMEYFSAKSQLGPAQQNLDIQAGPSAPSWMDLIIDYIKGRTLLSDKNEARRLLYQDAKYTLIDAMLYRRGHSLPLLQGL